MTPTQTTATPCTAHGVMSILSMDNKVTHMGTWVPCDSMPADIRRGTILANGARVLSARAIGHSRWIVLAEREGTYDPFVTWEATSVDNTYWGHYFGGLVEAMRDYDKR